MFFVNPGWWFGNLVVVFSRPGSASPRRASVFFFICWVVDHVASCWSLFGEADKSSNFPVHVFTETGNQVISTDLHPAASATTKQIYLYQNVLVLLSNKQLLLYKNIEYMRNIGKLKENVIVILVISGSPPDLHWIVISLFRIITSNVCLMWITINFMFPCFKLYI